MKTRFDRVLEHYPYIVYACTILSAVLLTAGLMALYQQYHLSIAMLMVAAAGILGMGMTTSSPNSVRFYFCWLGSVAICIISTIVVYLY